MPPSPKDESTQLGGRFRDQILRAFTKGQRAGEAYAKNPNNGMSALMFMEEYTEAGKLWEEVMDFLRRQVEDAQRQRSAPQSPPPANPPEKKK